MTMGQLATLIAKAEGKKREVAIGDIREVLAILSDMAVDPRFGGVLMTLFKNGERRAKRKPNARAKR